MRRSRLGRVCAATCTVVINGELRTALEWANAHGLKWQAVKMRRYRGACWEEAFSQPHRGKRISSSPSSANLQLLESV